MPRPIIPYYSNVSQILQKHVSATLANRATAEESLKNAQSEVQEMIKSYGIR
ncbi:MAG: hypothetical protein GQF41_1509 [Candidatus Rifleibacterium amylolyticum]|nr:MAG: hypothetical protein GQF41_1509 [Candidatus Rifleibacterium amylolyticum]